MGHPVHENITTLGPRGISVSQDICSSHWCL